ncbi:MAG TPA: CRISPR system precrRNA processing endoribonuclease RAMP protein Cas6 [Desulfomonilia bacterium]
MIEAPITKKTHWTKGELFDFDIILLGKANEYLPYFVYAIEQMGQTGIGKMIDGFRSTFNLVSVKANRKLIYSGKERKLVKGSFTKNISAGRFAKIKESEISGITVVLQTPLRLKFENNLKRAELPFHVLIRACLRRISTLFETYGKGEPALDYKGLISLAETVRTVHSDLSWHDWRRYSSRQDQEMLMGGLVGNIIYEGNVLNNFLPILKFCETVHIGKQTSFGLGKFELFFEGEE